VTAKATTETAADDGVLRIGEGAEEPKRDVLFRLGGKEYQGLTNPPASVLFRYMDLLRKRGADVATSWLLEEILDGDAYTVLTTSETLSRPDFRKVCDLVRTVVFGTDAVPKSPSSGSRRTGG
jgi:hypothetical protein